jgi:hypothetical protein
MNCDDASLIKKSTQDLKLVTGKILQQILVNVVEPEFNVLHLQVDEIWFSIYGRSGSDYLGIYQRIETFEEKILGYGNWVGKLPMLDCFLGKKIVAARQIGKSCDGHGFEFGFEDLTNTTLLVQSIYTGTEPKGFNDCIRIGIGNYVCEMYNPGSHIDIEY